MVVSQWSVNDKATAELMQSFYQHYISDKLDKSRSLQCNEPRSLPLKFSHYFRSSFALSVSRGVPGDRKS